MKNNQSTKNYSNITSYDKVARSNDVMKNNKRIKICNITNNDKVTRNHNGVMKNITQNSRSNPNKTNYGQIMRNTLRINRINMNIENNVIANCGNKMLFKRHDKI